MKKELAALYHFNLEDNVFLNEEIGNNKEKENNEKANDEKDNIHLKTSTIYNSGKGVIQGVKIGVEIADLVHDINYVNNLKNIINTFINGCKSSLLFIVVGCLIGGIINVGLIIYEGNLFSDFFEKALIKDGGEDYLIGAAKSYNKAIKSFKDLAEINDDEIIIYE